MATLTAAFGTSHSIMLTSRKEDWQYGFKEVDPRNPHYFDREGNHRTYEELLAVAPADSESMVTPEKMAERFDAADAAMNALRDRIAAADLDVLLVAGDDQTELFRLTNMPAIAIYYGETIRNAQREALSEDDSWYRHARAQRQEPDGDVHYPVDSELAEWLIRRLSDKEFDITALAGLEGEQFEGHAFSFPHRRYLSHARLPVVPIMVNTFDPPNQPTAKRCVALGRALRELIAEYPKDLKVGIMASGGLSHFVVDEEFDHQLIEAFRSSDLDYLASIDPRRLKAGSSEIRNWIVVAAAATDLELDWAEYVPGYRTPALTGTGLCFASWKPVSQI
jgi:hypothetical protein